ncbi:uroporphyrinogen-III C-methyltransferase [Qingshengfaniella alkalisoli]|uniref:uroporphyrinogen-III C-methyltransferase n=1 Tax=Qingshengfaniella alkalisoli TaxID=2599296 RepID=A0A5B8I779_9RHOB|nr:uroporphyrinogen-III C-methyltransferase [Qingshengfaniella alkalisoli]QDY69555.1 uroporphyrinogen-III C-methyltransferase [Qingshengfaniella alkalisoli]
MTDHAKPEVPAFDWPEFPAGLVWLVGAGPGDPGLLSLLGLHALRQADVVIHDALVNPQILEWRKQGAQAEYAGKRGGRPSADQRDISARLVELAKAGKRVLRLKGGDPFVFGRGGEEVQTLLDADVPVRVTPGVSAGIGGLAYAGIPVTHRLTNQVVTFLTGHDLKNDTTPSIDWQAIARGSPVLVMYMALRHIDRIAARLIEAGRAKEEPVAVVTNATLPNMKVLETTLATCAADVVETGLTAPAIICVGKVVSLRAMTDWLGSSEG